ncbi:polysaccharide deacetylase, partial [Erysipelatoclostridium ramosum]|nr:polysaccharide deacetylase [Thomasclavelia ramosa]
QVSKEYENEAFVSFTYPAYKEKNLNTIVKAYEKKAVTAASKAEKQITSIDYDSSLLFDRYVNLAFHRYTYDAEGVQRATETTWILYDKKQGKQLVLDDVLRREYPVLVKKLAD